MKHEWSSFLLDGEWQMYFAKSENVINNYTCFEELETAGFEKIKATVPGNFELDMFAAGLIEEPYYADNILKLKELEDIHLWYCTSFTYSPNAEKQQFLKFEGIDTFGEIYLNGVKIGESDNALIPFEFPVELLNGENRLMVHIIPDYIEARKHMNELFSTSFVRIGSLYVRKAPHTYGWDIMPRAVSGGIWRSVSVVEKPYDRIEQAYMVNNWVDPDRSTVRLYFGVALSDANARNYTIRAKASCGESSFEFEKVLWHTTGVIGGAVESPKLWWPRNMGEPNLYDVRVELLCKGEVVDVAEFRHGIRSVKLEMTDTFDKDGNGQFCFYINKQPFFAFGTNWVPMDAFHSRDAERLPRALEMLDDLGCNIVRCWGGNVYEADEFYDFCDTHGIVIWQDFSMACATYPQDDYFCDAIRREAEKVVRHLREHPSIILWSGDNECDEAVSNPPFGRNPDNNKLTRQVLPQVLYSLDPTRPYLPSSPYMSGEAVRTGQRRNTPEQHMWGPRDYFKSDYYVNRNAVFASEIGYHGCNSPESIKKFISPESLWPWNGEHNWDNREWLVHATCTYPDLLDPDSYRIKLMADQVKTLIGYYPDNLDEFAFASQVSQAEAKKYFIERFRAYKGQRTGVIWWNLVDGWPQFSDAIVDYYYTKKIAYNYIKNSQQSVCLMFREPCDGVASLVAVNELMEQVELKYTVKALSSGKTVISGNAVLGANCDAVILNEQIMDTDTLEVYLIEWMTADGVVGKNHYTCTRVPFDIERYKALMQGTDILKTEGF